MGDQTAEIGVQGSEEKQTTGWAPNIIVKWEKGCRFERQLGCWLRND